MTWAPHVTVATIIERDNRFLLVYEVANGQQVYNQPAGHLEPNETLLEAALRETHAWIQYPKNFDRALKLANEIFPVSAPAMKDMIARFRYELDRKSVEANLAFFEKSGIIKGPVRFEDVVLAD